MREIMELPETFGVWDCGRNDLCINGQKHSLLVNSGCWACRFNKDWRNERVNGSLLAHFAIKDKIQFNSTTGRYETVVMPEDWHFSRQLNKMGCKILATRKIRLGHKGDLYYPNDSVWGDYRVDEDLRHKWGKGSLP